MAKCNGCGVELIDGTVFCPYCGAQVEKSEEKEVEVIDNFNSNFDDVLNTPVQKEKTVFKVFAIISMIAAILVLILNGLSVLSLSDPMTSLFLAAYALEFSLPGFIFGCIGRKSTSQRGKATFGFVANLICLILAFILIFYAAFIFVAQGGSVEDIYGSIYM